MNKVAIMGRLTRDPEVRYSQSANPVAVARYGIAVNRRFAKDGEQKADFFNVVAFGKAAEFVEKYFRKGNMIAIVGKLQSNQWEDQQKVRHTSVEIVAEEQHFTGAKHSEKTTTDVGAPVDAFVQNNQEEDDDLPF